MQVGGEAGGWVRVHAYGGVVWRCCGAMVSGVNEQ